MHKGSRLGGVGRFLTGDYVMGKQSMTMSPLLEY